MLLKKYWPNVYKISNKSYNLHYTFMKTPGENLLHTTQKKPCNDAQGIKSHVRKIHDRFESIEKQEIALPPVYKIDISRGWDTESQVALFHKGLKKLPFYRPGLLYSGFDGNKIGITFHSECGEWVVFCNYEEVMGDLTEFDNPFEYAHMYDNPAIAVYNPEKLKQTPDALDCEYIIDDLWALIAIIKL